MKPMLKRIFPFIIGGAVVVFAACQDSSQNPTDPGVAPLEGRGGPTLQSQINQVIKLVWPKGHDDRKKAKKAKATMFGAGQGTAAAQAAAVELEGLALSSGADDAEEFISLIRQFSGIQPGATFVKAAMGGVVTNNLDNSDGFAGVEFEQFELPKDVVVIVEQVSQPCHPLAQLPNQEPGCFSFRTIPELAEFNESVLVGVCTNVPEEGQELLRLFESQGPNDNTPVVLLDEEETPGFLDCDDFMASTESSWLENFAHASWDKVGRPLASLFAPQPAYATTLVVRAGSLGGRTKNFSNIGWAETDDLQYGAEGYRYMQFGVGQDPTGAFHTPGFDDSGWFIGDAPFWHNPGGACDLGEEPAPGAGTKWTAAGEDVVDASLATEIVLRKYFFLPEGATDVEVEILIDNDVQVWVNSVKVSGTLPQTHEDCFDDEPLDGFPVDIGDVTRPGVNLLVVRGIDRGVMSYVDAKVTFTPAP